MRGLVLSLVLGTLVVSGALPAIAQPAAETPFHHDYVADAQARMRVWGRDVRSLHRAVAAAGRAQDSAAEAELNAAWSQAKVEEQRMEVASAAQWEGARTTFDDASRRFAVALNHAQSRVE